MEKIHDNTLSVAVVGAGGHAARTKIMAFIGLFCRSHPARHCRRTSRLPHGAARCSHSNCGTTTCTTKHQFRTHRCGDLSDSTLEHVKLCGWLQQRHKLGSLTFAVLRDSTGSVQLKLDTTACSDALRSVSLESIVQVTGNVCPRPEKDRRTSGTATESKRGGIEVEVESFRVINPCEPLPFHLFDTKGRQGQKHTATTLSLDPIYLKHRHLALRHPSLQKNLWLRHKVLSALRQTAEREQFLEVETPYLFKSTPEGASEFVVPSTELGKFYALPQSPQQYKQLLMSAGVERYFQVARCFRKENGRSHRQPEFTQFDLEMAFAGGDDVMRFVERAVTHALGAAGHAALSPFPVLSFEEALLRYGTDKPDTRYGLEIVDITTCVPPEVWAASGQTPGVVRAIRVVDGRAHLSRRSLQTLVSDVREHSQSAPLLPVTFLEGKARGPKFATAVFPYGIESPAARVLQLRESDVVLLCTGSRQLCESTLGRTRVKCAELLKTSGGLLAQRSSFPNPSSQLHFLWVVDFPLFESTAEGGLQSSHHPFTAPNERDLHLLESGHDVTNAKGKSYDLVLNGVELGGGSVRIHEGPLVQLLVLNSQNIAHVQEAVFRQLGTDASTFSHLMKALRSGCPPHAGFALGVDRFVAALAGSESLREVIAFPKALSGTDLLVGSPTQISAAQAKALGFST